MQTKYITPQEVAKISARLPKVSRTIWLLMNDTGLRISDVVKLKYTDIDKKGQIHYTSTKTGKKGIAKPSSTVLSLIGRKTVPEYIFKSAKNPKKHIHRSTVFRHIKTACKLCGINPDGIAPHTARKNFAVRDFRENGLGKTMLDLQHSSPATTLFYALSDDPIPQIFGQLKVLKQQINFNYDKILELFEICDRIFERIENFDEPLPVKIADQKKAGE